MSSTLDTESGISTLKIDSSSEDRRHSNTRGLVVSSHPSIRNTPFLESERILLMNEGGMVTPSESTSTAVATCDACESEMPQLARSVVRNDPAWSESSDVHTTLTAPSA